MKKVFFSMFQKCIFECFLYFLQKTAQIPISLEFFKPLSLKKGNGKKHLHTLEKFNTLIEQIFMLEFAIKFMTHEINRWSSICLRVYVPS
jgi:hypothetical protein